MARLIAGVRLKDNRVQVNALTLDWQTGARENQNTIPGFLNGSRFIIPVANATVRLLEAKNIRKSQTNLVGHSWGALVVNEISQAGSTLSPSIWNRDTDVERIVALDPAVSSIGLDLDPYDGYVNFKYRSKKSISIVGASLSVPQAGAFGSPRRASTADICIQLDPEGTNVISPFILHAGPVYAFYDALARRKNEIGREIWGATLDLNTPYWRRKGYYNGLMVGPVTGGRYQFNQFLELYKNSTQSPMIYLY